MASALLSSVRLFAHPPDFVSAPYWVAWFVSVFVVAGLACRLPGVACDELGNETTMAIAEWCAPFVLFSVLLALDRVGTLLIRFAQRRA